MPQPPRRAILRFERELRKLALLFRKLVLARLDLTKYAGKEQTKTDADVDDALRGVNGPMLKAIARLSKAANDVAEATVKNSKFEFDRYGIKVKEEPDFDGLVRTWRKQNLERITSLFEEEVPRLEKILEGGARKTVDQLANEIEWRLDVTRGKAELLARDQVYTLDAQITAHRQQAAGIKSYIWTTQRDDRVRESHEELDGEEFYWDDPPIVDDEPAHPGWPINCRCRAFPVLPDSTNAADPED